MISAKIYGLIFSQGADKIRRIPPGVVSLKRISAFTLGLRRSNSAHNALLRNRSDVHPHSNTQRRRRQLGAAMFVWWVLHLITCSKKEFKAAYIKVHIIKPKA